MKCKIFTGTWYEAQDAFNQWAKGKALSREVLIHTIPLLNSHPRHETKIIIAVYHPEDPYWDKTEPTLTAPIHNIPIPHIKVEEVEVAVPASFTCSVCGAEVKQTDYNYKDFNIYRALYLGMYCESCARKHDK